MDRKVTIRFYEISTVGEGNADIEGALRMLNLLSKRDREVEVDDGITLRLEQIATHDGLLVGDITRVQTRNLPGHVVDDDLNRLPVDRIGHSSAFLYDPATRCMAVQFDMSLGIGRVCRYLRTALPGPDFSYLPYLKGDTLARFRHQSPTRLRLKVARVRNFARLGAAKTDFEDQIEEWSNLFDAPSVEIILSTRGADNMLDRAHVWNTVRRWIGYKDVVEGIKNIEADTLETDDGFNFIKDLLQEDDVLDLPDNNPLASREVRQQYLRECYEQHRAYIANAAGL
jgi:hypothetical protein